MRPSDSRLFLNLVSGAPLKQSLLDPGPGFIDQLQQARLFWDWLWRKEKGLL